MTSHLVKAELTTLTSPDQYHAALEEWRGRYNILTPFTSIVGMAASHVIRVHELRLDLDPFRGGDIYGGYLEDGRKGMPFLKGARGSKDEEFAIAKTGLRRLADLASMSTGATRKDNGMQRGYWCFEGYVVYTALNGQKVRKTATAEWDLMEGSDRMRGWKPDQISESRKNGLRNAETRAINAAIREAGIGIKQKYTRTELEKPFLVIEVSFVPDMNDPEIKRLVTQHALGGADLMYGSPSRQALPAGDVDASGEAPRSVGRGTTSQATPPPPAADEPPTPEAVKILSVTEEPFTYVNGNKKGQQGKRWRIIDSPGNNYTTIDHQIRDDATRFCFEKAWVEIATDSNGSYVNILEIVRAGSNPRLPDMERT